MRKIKVFQCNYTELEKEIEKWQTKNNFDICNISVSLDGISCVALITYWNR